MSENESRLAKIELYRAVVEGTLGQERSLSSMKNRLLSEGFSEEELTAVEDSVRQQYASVG